MINLHAITHNIISALEEGVETGNWTKPWKTIASGFPLNALTQNQYNGINVLILNFKAHRNGWTSPYWAGLRQWNRIGGKVKKGSTHTKILRVEHKIREEEKNNGEIESHAYTYLQYLRVFNADQIDGWTAPEEEKVPLTEDDYISAIDQWTEKTGITIKHGFQQACFVPSIDEIHLPNREDFITTKDAPATYNYYSTLFHELGHATGHEKRLKRDLSGRFGSSKYGLEELVAELTSAFLSAQFEISDHTAPRPDHVKYLSGWIKAIKQNPQVLVSSAARAKDAVGWLNEQEEKQRKEAA